MFVLMFLTTLSTDLVKGTDKLTKCCTQLQTCIYNCDETDYFHKRKKVRKGVLISTEIGTLTIAEIFLHAVIGHLSLEFLQIIK